MENDVQEASVSDLYNDYPLLKNTNHQLSFSQQ